MSFKEFVEQEEKIVALLCIMENLDTINECELNEEQIFERFRDILGKAGLKLHKSKGILSYIKSITGSIGKLFLHIVKGDIKKAKELIKTLEKEDILDFLYKLDLGTLHLFTGPLHIIDAWTGWQLTINLKNKLESGKNIINTIKKSIHKIKKDVSSLFLNEPKKQKNLIKNLDNFETSLT